MSGLKWKAAILASTIMLVASAAMAGEKYRVNSRTEVNSAAKTTTVLIEVVDQATGKAVTGADIRHLEIILHEKGAPGGMMVHEHALTPDGRGGYSYTFPYLFREATTAKFRGYAPGSKDVIKADVQIKPGT
jgi:hypothetical protein